jgi:hypothetical protein
MRIKAPFMIEKDNNYARVSYDGNLPLTLTVKWVDWEGSRWADKEKAQGLLDDPSTAHLFEGAKVVEILDEIRTRIPAAR